MNTPSVVYYDWILEWWRIMAQVIWNPTNTVLHCALSDLFCSATVY